MNAPRPPAKCPCCGEDVEELAKTWHKVRGPGRDALRVPVSLTATYCCGAVIAAKFIIRSSVLGALGSHGNGAHWEVQVEKGCPEVMLREMRRSGKAPRASLFD